MPVIYVIFQPKIRIVSFFLYSIGAPPTPPTSFLGTGLKSVPSAWCSVENTTFLDSGMKLKILHYAWMEGNGGRRQELRREGDQN